MGSNGNTGLAHVRTRGRGSPRRAPLNLLCAAAVSLTMSGPLVGCGRGDAQVDALQAHVRAVVERIEAHPRDPSAALRAVAAYERDHATELDALRAASKTLRRDLGTQAKRALHERWIRETRDLRVRMQAIRQAKR